LSRRLLSVLRWERGPRVSHITGLYLIAGLCGLVDAACFLSLGQVFAEMMTGNLLLFCFYVGTGHPIFQHAVYLIALGLITYVPAITLAPLQLWR